MADKPTTPGPGRRKRVAPTIDLTATEVPRAAAASKSSAAGVETPHPSAAPPHVAPEPPPAAEAQQPGHAAASGAAAPPPHDPLNWIRSHLSAPSIMAGFAGAALMTLVLFGLWLTGMVPIRYAGSTATRARVAALEMELHALQSRTAAAVDTKAINALSERVSTIQDTVAKLPRGDAGMAERITAADNAMKSLGLALTALTHRSDDIAASAGQARDRAEAAEKAVTELRGSLQDVARASAGVSTTELDTLQKRIAELEQSAKLARDEIAKTGALDTAARLALSAAALRDAAFRGAPFAQALAQTRSLGADPKALAPLEQFAATGLPAPAALAEELRALLPGMIKASGAQAPADTFLERLQANAGNLVRVRPVGAPGGDDASAVLARVEIAAAKGDIGGALADLAKLSDAARAPAQAWIAKVQARQAALSAAQMLAAETARSLGSK